MIARKYINYIVQNMRPWWCGEHFRSSGACWVRTKSSFPTTCKLHRFVYIIYFFVKNLQDKTSFKTISQTFFWKMYFTLDPIRFWSFFCHIIFNNGFPKNNANSFGINVKIREFFFKFVRGVLKAIYFIRFSKKFVVALQFYVRANHTLNNNACT